MRRKILGLVMMLIACVVLPMRLTVLANPNPHSPSDSNQFVRKVGTQLMLHGHPFRFGGANIYWLQLDENVGGVNYPTYFRVKDALLTAKQMGATVIRTMLSVGSPRSIEPSLGNFNPNAFKTLDYAIFEAKQLHLHLYIDLVDNYKYYDGGRSTFTGWFGDSNENDFYTNPKIIDAFQQYVSHVLNHVNPYTGLALKNDPTIMTWELGNELTNMPQSWIDLMATYVRQMAPKQLIAADQQFGINPATLTSPNIDIVAVHYYPPSVTQIESDASQVTKAGKVYIVGEYGSTSASNSLLTPVAQDPNVTGAMFWSLFGHNDTYGYVQHNDGYTLHYPGDTPSMQKNVKAIEMFDHEMAPHLAIPSNLLGRPIITSIVKQDGENVIAWRGATNAVGYIVQRSTEGAGSGWTNISSTTSLVTDNNTPWMDLSSPQGPTWYRVVPFNAQGDEGHVSNSVEIGASQGVLVDTLETWDNTSSHSSDLAVTPVHEHVLVSPSANIMTDQPTQITWSHIAITGFQARFQSHSVKLPIQILTSTDGKSWTPVNYIVTKLGPTQSQVSISPISGVNEVRVEWTSPDNRHSVKPPAIERATIDYAQPTVVDNLNNWSKTYAHSSDLTFDSTNPSEFSGDTSRVKRYSTSPDWVEWKLDGLKDFSMIGYSEPSQPATFSVYTSSDGTSWTLTHPTITGGAGNWIQDQYTLIGLHDVNFVKVAWNNLTGDAWSPQIASVNLYGTGPSIVSPPGQFQQQVVTTLVYTPTTLSWTPSPNAAYYSLKISTSADMSNPIVSVTGLQTTMYTASTLSPGTKYYWAVTATNGAGEVSASNSGISFTVASLPTAPLIVEDFNEYGGSNVALQASYIRNSNGGPIAVALNNAITDGSSTYSLAVTYDPGSPGYAGVTHVFASAQNWWGYTGIEFWLKPDGTGRSITLQFVSNGAYFQATYTPTGTAPVLVKLPFTSFATPSWATPEPMNLTKVTQFSLYFGGAAGSGLDYFDNFRVYP